MSDEAAVIAGTATEVVPTGKHQHASSSYPPEQRWLRRNGVMILQVKWECTETDYDDETSRTWKEWRDVPVVEE